MIYPIFSYFLLPRAFTLHMAVQRAEITSKQMDSLKKQRFEQRFFHKVQRYAPRGAYLTLFFRKKCCGTPLGGAIQLYFSLLWGLTDRQVSLPPFRVLPRSGGPELSKTWPAQDFSCSWFLFRGELASASSFSGRFRVRSPSHPLGWPRAFSWFSFRGELASASSFSGRFQVK